MNVRNKVMLLWEDDDDFIRMFTLFLHEHGCVMQSVKTFNACVASCISQPPALLIVRSFINEPRDGLQFIRKIRRDSRMPYFPIIVGYVDFTDYKTEQGQRETFASGANAYFGRVFDITDVLREIELLLNNPIATGIIDK